MLQTTNVSHFKYQLGMKSHNKQNALSFNKLCLFLTAFLTNVLYSALFCLKWSLFRIIVSFCLSFLKITLLLCDSMWHVQFLCAVLSAKVRWEAKLGACSCASCLSWFDFNSSSALRQVLKKIVHFDLKYIFIWI